MILTKDREAPVMVDETEWDDFVMTHADGDLLQTTRWARVKASAHQPIRVVLRRDDAVCAGAQVLVRRIARVIAIGYVPYGPVADTVDDAEVVLDQLEAEARRLGVCALLIQPPRQRHDLALQLRSRGYQRAAVDVATAATVEVPLRRSSTELEDDLSRSKRKNLKKSVKARVEVHRAGRDELPAFHRLHVMSGERGDFLPMSLAYLERQWDELHHHGHLELFMAEIDGKPVAGGIVTVFNGRVEFKLTGFDTAPELRQVCANDAVQWQMLHWANDAGHQAFDLGGLPLDHAEALRDRGVEGTEYDHTGTRFKLGYGGRVALFPVTYERPLGVPGALVYRPLKHLSGDQGLGGRLVNWLRRS